MGGVLGGWEECLGGREIEGGRGARRVLRYCVEGPRQARRPRPAKVEARRPGGRANRFFVAVCGAERLGQRRRFHQ